MTAEQSLAAPHSLLPAVQGSRSEAALERDAIHEARSELWRLHEETAERRDREAESREAAAAARDVLADALDAEIEEIERTRLSRDGEAIDVADLIRRAADDRRRAAENRARAAEDRAEAARDRELARRDRERAAQDREILTVELAEAGVDHLTGALRRRVGLAAIQREIDRTARSGEPCVIAFIDVDGLKEINDTRGHLAGDALLRGVVACITSELRRFDLITRYGGDEFVCSLSGQTIDGARRRFESISTGIAGRLSGASITVGLVERAPDEHLDAVILRADRAMLSGRDGRHR